MRDKKLGNFVKDRDGYILRITKITGPQGQSDGCMVSLNGATPYPVSDEYIKFYRLGSPYGVPGYPGLHDERKMFQKIIDMQGTVIESLQIKTNSQRASIILLEAEVYQYQLRDSFDEYELMELVEMYQDATRVLQSKDDVYPDRWGKLHDTKEDMKRMDDWCRKQWSDWDTLKAQDM